jgi:hypothetical protein
MTVNENTSTMAANIVANGYCKPMASNEISMQ